MAINLITRRGFLSQHSASTGGDAGFIMQSLSEQGRPRRSFSPSARPRCPHQVFKARDPQAQEAQERPARPKPPPPGPYAAPKGYSIVPEIDVRVAAGPGAWNDEPEEIKEAWLFADPLIRHEFRAKPDDLRMITVDGDSMEPLLSSGDRILIDVSRQVPSPPGIFVIWDGLGLVAKRIEHVPHSDPARVVLKSLNPEYDSYERSAEEVRIVGRAVWVSRRL